MNLEFLPEAQAEFKRAINYYEGKEKGLGKRLRDEVREVCSAIQDHPSIWREREGGFRRVNCPVFPYYIAYFIREDTILIAAIGHGSKHPDYWKQRVR